MSQTYMYTLKRLKISPNSMQERWEWWLVAVKPTWEMFITTIKRHFECASLRFNAFVSVFWVCNKPKMRQLCVWKIFRTNFTALVLLSTSLYCICLQKYRSSQVFIWQVDVYLCNAVSHKKNHKWLFGR